MVWEMVSLYFIVNLVPFDVLLTNKRSLIPSYPTSKTGIRSVLDYNEPTAKGYWCGSFDREQVGFLYYRNIGLGRK